MTTKNYKISILWGESPDNTDKPVAYSFETKAELDAFTLGISEMDGWQGYDIVSLHELEKQEKMTTEELQKILDALEDLYDQTCEAIPHINRNAGLDFAMGEALEIIKEYSTNNQ